MLTDAVTDDAVTGLRPGAAATSGTSAVAHEILQRVFGYPAFRGHQAEAIVHVSDGNDALILMPTGAGKSLCYQVPSLVRGQRGLGCGIVVSPLIALMQDQVSALSELGVRAAFLNSSQSGERAAEVERAFRGGKLDLLYVAPERLLTERCLQLLSSAPVSLFAIDEAHCVSQWGHDFRPEYMQLALLGKRFPGVPRVALTATADPATRIEIVERLELGTEANPRSGTVASPPRTFVSSFDRPNIRYEIVEKGDARRQLLDFIRADHAGHAGIVYCLSRRRVDETAAYLVEQGINALPYHAGMDSETRARNQSRFLRDDGIVMVATIAFGMGIDKPDVRFVAHLDLPKSIEGYYQETGRGGRDGLASDAWMAYGLQDVVQLRRMIDESEGSEQYKRVSSGKLDAMLGLCETATCRRALLLAYFGEDDAVGTSCGNCDNCLTPPETFDATVPVQQLLSCIYRLKKERGQSFGALHVIAVLRGERGGKAAEKIASGRHDTLSTFGIGADRSEAEWRAIVRQCIAFGYVDVDHESYGTLHLTDRSRAVLKGEAEVRLRRFVAQAKRPKGKPRKDLDVADGLDAEAATLFDALRSWRLAAAREHGVPAYVIFHDGTLKEIARARPTTLAALGALSGVGEKKLEAYGRDIVGIVERAAD
jgi:ATP-dependent DNA helicase RecQ